jgi:hypothetical protein
MNSMQRPEERVVAVRADLLSEVRKIALLLSHHEQIMAGLRNDMHHLLLLGHGIDTNEPGWRLDVDSGVLANVPVQVPSLPQLSVVPEQDEPDDQEPA